MSKQVHVLFGSTGEYSDRVEWAVAAYLKAEDAEAHRAMAEKWCREKGVSATLVKNGSSWSIPADYEARDALAKLNPFDPEMDRIDYSGVDYYVVPVDLRDSVPESA